MTHLVYIYFMFHFCMKKGVARLTRNERAILRTLLRDSRTTDVEIGNKLKISSQAVSKLRRRLERMGVIKKYSVDLDYSSLGLHTFALILFNISFMDTKDYSKFLDELSGNLFIFYKIYKNEATHIGLFGFRNLNELYSMMHSISLKFHDDLIEDVYIFPADGLIKHSFIDLFNITIRDLGNENMPVIPDLMPYLERKLLKDEVKLSMNEKIVLGVMLKNSRISGNKIVKEIKNMQITGRGVWKIQKRLEEKGIIKGYSLNLDYESLGLNIFSFIFVKINKDYLKDRDMLTSFAQKSGNIIGCYKLYKALYVLFCGFRSLNELEHYCHALESQTKDFFSISRIYIASNKGREIDSNDSLYNSLIRGENGD